MPCRVSSGVHEWINEVLTVPAWDLVNPQPGAQSRDPRWGEHETPPIHGNISNSLLRGQRQVGSLAGAAHL